MLEIYPSLMSANLLILEEQIKILEPYCDGFHLDVMDYHFVPNLAFNFDCINQIRKITQKKLHIHLMVEYPEKYINKLNLEENDIISIHIESPTTIPFEDILYKISELKLMPSIALNPFTPLESIISLQYRLQHVLLMSVNPGFSGQTLIPHVITKLKSLNSFKVAHNLNFKISVDGGINPSNCLNLKTNGANQLTMSSSIFDNNNLLENIKLLKTICS